MTWRTWWSGALAVALCAASIDGRAAAGDELLQTLCLRGFEPTKMPLDEAQRFCTCVRADVSPRLTGRQREVLTKVGADLAQGRAARPEVLANSGLRDLVIAGQARCEAAYYPPSAPIRVRSGQLELTLRCDDTGNAPEAFMYLRTRGLLSKAELAAMDKKMMAGEDVLEVAQVTQRIDGVARRVERGEIDLTGQIVASPDPAALIAALRAARTFDVAIERGRERHVASFDLAGKIAPRWAPCGGIGK